MATNVDSCSSIADNYQKYEKYFDDSSSTSQYTIDMFYQLLLAEMQNQDPMEPTSNTEFVSQMASFTGVQAQQDALYYQQTNYASSLVGKTVIVASSTGTDDVKSVTGVVTNMNLSGDDVEITVNGESYKLKNVMEIVDTGASSTTTNINTDGAYATSLIGKKVAVTATDSTGATIVNQGVVSVVQAANNTFSVVIDNVAYPVSSVVKVEENTESAAGTEETEDTSSTTDATDTAAEATDTTTGTESAASASSTGSTNSDEEDEDESDTETETTTNVTVSDGKTITTTETVTTQDGTVIDTDTSVSVTDNGGNETEILDEKESAETEPYTQTDEADIEDLEELFS